MLLCDCFRVKQALAKKEETINTMREQYQVLDCDVCRCESSELMFGISVFKYKAAVKRAEHFEMLLQRQRQELTKLQS